MGQRADFSTRDLKLLTRRETTVLKKMEALLGVNLARDMEQLGWTRSTQQSNPKGYWNSNKLEARPCMQDDNFSSENIRTHVCKTNGKVLCLSFEGFQQYLYLSVLLLPERRQKSRAKDLMVLKKHIIANMELLLEWFGPVHTDHRAQAMGLWGSRVNTHRQCPCIISCSKPRIHRAQVF